MYTDRSTLAEYAYQGLFFRRELIPAENGDLIGDDGNLLDDDSSTSQTGSASSGETETEVAILQTVCDIQETNKLFNSGVVTMGYTIYFPNPTDTDGNEAIPEGLVPGIRFRGEMYGMAVEGMVIGVYPTQMHGCVAYIKGTDI